MATTSTFVTVKQRLVTLLDAELSVPVTYAWPGANTASEAVFLGRHPALGGNDTDIEHQIPTLKAGRKARQEEFVVPLTVWSFRPELTAEGAETAETRGFVLLQAVEDVLADDPQLGETAIQYATLDTVIVRLEPFEQGWASALECDITARARLT